MSKLAIKLCKRERKVLQLLQAGEYTRNALNNRVLFDVQDVLKALLKKNLIVARREYSPRWGFKGYRTLYKGAGM